MGTMLGLDVAGVIAGFLIALAILFVADFIINDTDEDEY